LIIDPGAAPLYFKVAMRYAPPTASAALVVLLAGIAEQPLGARSAPGMVRVETGFLEGVAARGVLTFKGIPYAAPPVGPLRWRAPRRAPAWSGVRKAAAFGSDCMQLPGPGDAAPIATRPSEDCLKLNVWRPAEEGRREGLPVLVWIHGGAFVHGGSSSPVYDGSNFARQGIVFISFNYRLGRFGFFAHPALTAAAEGALGNYGYLDQIAALEWVRRNARAFGGDPGRVTVMGEGAGGAAILDMLASGSAAGLFHRAAVMSGGGRTTLLGGLPLRGNPSEGSSAESAGMRFAKGAGIPGTGRAALEALRALPAEAVTGDLDMSKLNSASDPPAYAEGPILDGKTRVAPPEAMLGRDSASRMPLLIGTTSRDLGLSPAPRDKRELFAGFGPDSAAARAAYDPDGGRPFPELAAAVNSDRSLSEPARFAAGRLASTGSRVWLYRFAYVADTLRGRGRDAPQASEIPFVFGTLAFRYGAMVTPRDRAMSRAVNAYFANFVKHGDPDGQGLRTWTSYHADRSDLMIFTPDRGPMVAADPWKERLDLLERAAESPARAEAPARKPAQGAQPPG
jgi:para-nitrobenzyl esterase